MKLRSLRDSTSYWRFRRTCLEIKRKMIQRHMDNGLFPYTKRYLGTLRNFFSTLGVNGINEMIRNFTSEHRRYHLGVGPCLCRSLPRSYPRPHRGVPGRDRPYVSTWRRRPLKEPLTALPAKTASVSRTFCKPARDDEPYYTNSSQLPVGFTDDPFDALQRQEELQRKYTGGTVLHLYMGERISSAKVCEKLVRRALENFRLPYITISPTFSVCPKHGYLDGEHTYCPKCDADLIASKELAVTK